MDAFWIICQSSNNQKVNLPEDAEFWETLSKSRKFLEDYIKRENILLGKEFRKKGCAKFQLNCRYHT